MKTSLGWLNSFLDRPVTADEAESLLTDVGFPIESREKAADDEVLDVEVTSNRVDCLCHTGIAREIAAATGRKFSPTGAKLPLKTSLPPAASLTSVDNQAPDLCPLYTARILCGVKVAPSPAWLADRLRALGLRPINNVVDVTNYVLHEMGQPLHAFDLNKLDGHRIVVRRAAPGETLTAIDGSKLKLTPKMLVIADASRPQAVAGVMGGLDSEVTDATTDILLESARFDPLAIRSTGRALKLASDSSYRFERGVDPAGVERASQRAAQLIAELAGGTIADGVVASGLAPTSLPILQLRVARCKQVLGIDVPPARMVQFLAALGLTPSLADDVITCTIPSHRLDLQREIDLIEEIARLNGFAQIPVEKSMRFVTRRPQPAVQARQLVGRVLTAHGYFEAITFSFLPPKFAEPFRGGLELVKVDEEKKKAEPALRPSLLPSLLACRKSNQDAGNVGVKLFEVAQVFGRHAGQYVDDRKLALLTDAANVSESMRSMRGTLEELLQLLGHDKPTITPARPNPESSKGWGSSAEISVDGKMLGHYGPANAAILKLFDLQSPVILAELDYELLTSKYPPQPTVAGLSRFPAIERDLSIIVDEPVAWSAVEAAIRDAAPALLESLDFVTVYRGKPVPAGRKSVTLRMTFRDPSRTLQHGEVSPQVETVVMKLKGALQAELRT
jgi:phenylalanyl-tRNA synthetase beta chain